MEEAKKEPQAPLFEQLKDYAEIKLKLAKYQAIDSGSTIFASVIADVVVAISALLAFIFASFTLAFYLAEVFQSDWKGFGCTALIYLLIAIIFKFNKGGFERPIANAIVKKFFKNKQQNDVPAN
ncbi:phage holin family protein [Mucilaginibacter sp. dw_454]|uniref:phage holin family protein n=1 Tax=Mucilaginibacter sp. dw_454 TaxID=2720079 RepID=UPI001BD5B222|nr:phage holin family protein [Mucilaginibacter sp. dw_454]